MTVKTIFVLNPTAKPRLVEQEMAQRLPSLHGKALGFLWNSKPSGDHLLGRIEEVLAQRFELGDVLRAKKWTSSTPVYESILDQLSQRCHAVINGVGD